MLWNSWVYFGNGERLDVTLNINNERLTDVTVVKVKFKYGRHNIIFGQLGWPMDWDVLAGN